MLFKLRSVGGYPLISKALTARVTRADIVSKVSLMVCLRDCTWARHKSRFYWKFKQRELNSVRLSVFFCFVFLNIQVFIFFRLFYSSDSQRNKFLILFLFLFKAAYRRQWQSTSGFHYIFFPAGFCRRTLQLSLKITT